MVNQLTFIFDLLRLQIFVPLQIYSTLFDLRPDQLLSPSETLSKIHSFFVVCILQILVAQWPLNSNMLFLNATSSSWSHVLMKQYHIMLDWSNCLSVILLLASKPQFVVAKLCCLLVLYFIVLCCVVMCLSCNLLLKFSHKSWQKRMKQTLNCAKSGWSTNMITIIDHNVKRALSCLQCGL